MTDGRILQAAPRLVIAITREEDEKRLEEVLDSMNVPVCFQLRGKGTAPTEMMDIFGLRGTTRLLTCVLLPKSQVKPMFETMNNNLSFRHRGGGIAITIPISGCQQQILQVLNEEMPSGEGTLKGDERMMKEQSEYTVIWVSVASGYSDDVVDAARSAGAKGGTVMKGRRRNSEKVSRLFGISMQEAQDFVMIVVPREKKNETMSAITKVCGLGSEARGVVLALPVDEVMGLTR